MSVTEQEPAGLPGSELDALDAWWRAANYLSVGQIYLMGNPLLTEPLRPEHVKPRLLGHWGTTPGLMRLQPESEHPHGMSDAEFDALFTVDRPVIFAYHGYPWLIHRLTCRRNGHSNFHVRGYREEGTTTTPFDMVTLNDLDRFHLVMDVIDRVPGLASSAGHLRQLMVDKRIACRAYTREEGQDAPEITSWKWQY